MEIRVFSDSNHYFPLEAVKPEYLEKSGTTTVCGWKGTANYYSLNIAARPIRTRSGTTLSQKRRRRRSKGGWRSGAGSK